MNLEQRFCELVKQAETIVYETIAKLELDSMDCKDFCSPKNAASPVVTKLDLQIEQKLRTLIENHFPEDGIVGEELPAKTTNSGRRFIIDPIDGTIALVTGKPTFTTLLGLEIDGQFQYGWIYQPMLNHKWTALPNSCCNGPFGRCQTSCKTELNSAIISTTTPFMFEVDWQQKLFTQLEKMTWLCSIGGDAYQYGLLAQGRIDIIVENQMSLHDFAALVPVVTQAGGMITDFSGNQLSKDSNGEVLACANKKLHQQVLDIIKLIRPK